MVRGAWLVDWEQGLDPSYPHCGTGAVDSPPEMQKDRKKGLILGGDYSKALFSLSYSDNSSRILISGERFSTGLFFQRPWSSGIIGSTGRRCCGFNPDSRSEDFRWWLTVTHICRPPSALLPAHVVCLPMQSSPALLLRRFGLCPQHAIV